MSHDFPRNDFEAAAPDPLQHRREIEEMEQRFRQRSDRPAAEPSTTGAMDERVQEEMRQFFSESTQILEEIVPSLKRDDDHLSDTTGEIRRKIDAFFGDSGGSGMIRSERTMPIGAIELPPGVGAGSPAPQAPARSLPPLRQAARRPAGLESTPQLRRTSTPAAHPGAAPAPAASARPAAPPRSGLPALAQPAPAPAPAAARGGRPHGNGRSAPSGAKMDLKTALERLRRHGIVRDEAPTVAAAAPAPAAPPPPVHAAPPPQAPPAPPRPAPRPMREPEPIAPPRPVAFEPVQVDVPAYEPSRLRTPAADPADPFAPPPVPPAPLLSRPDSRSAVFDVPASAPAPLPPRLDARPAPLGETPAGFRAGGSAMAGQGLEIPRVEPIAPAQESGEGFDEIFAEVEGLVRGTLADSIEETLEEARVAEDNMRSGNRGRRPSAPRPPTTDSIRLKFAAPLEDEEECDEEDEAPSGPYNWGVGPANRPAGAWLLEEGAEEAARTQVHEKARKTGEITGIDVGVWREPPADDARDAPEPGGGRTAPPVPLEPTEPLAPPSAEPRQRDAEPSTGAMMGAGASSLLARKLEAESSRMAPIMDALAAKGLVDSDDDEDDEFDDDDEVSVASFKDDRPRGDAMGVTPMRIVEEIRRLRRIQEILMSKGLVSEDEIAAAAPSDG